MPFPSPSGATSTKSVPALEISSRTVSPISIALSMSGPTKRVILYIAICFLLIWLILSIHAKVCYYLPLVVATNLRKQPSVNLSQRGVPTY